MANFAIARKNMVECQIRPNNVRDERLIDAMMTLPRERFVPKHMQGFAYIDEDIDLGNGRFLQEPMVLARLIEAANLKSSDVVLDIGCGLGYSTALMARLASTVVGVEEDTHLAEQAEALLKSLDITNAVIFHGELTKGYKQQAPYDVILINGSLTEVPPKIFEQLIDGGRLITVIAEDGKTGQAVIYTRVRDVVSEKVIFDAATPLLKEFSPQEEFVF
jgi:protein-L-isoaspartate(D-aspartate) O-methyltransferase